MRKCLIVLILNTINAVFQIITREHDSIFIPGRDEFAEQAQNVPFSRDQRRFVAGIPWSNLMFGG
jgi:hypothetical protein